MSLEVRGVLERQLPRDISPDKTSQNKPVPFWKVAVYVVQVEPAQRRAVTPFVKRRNLKIHVAVDVGGDLGGDVSAA